MLKHCDINISKIFASQDDIISKGVLKGTLTDVLRRRAGTYKRTLFNI